MCNDGDPCSVESHCEGGSCQAGDATICQCQTTADCVDDDNPCTGKPYCDVTLFPYLCKVNPATVVSCPTAATPCTANACDPSDGKCKALPADADKVCNDGNPCTAGDKCQAGVCKGGSDTCVCGQDSDCDAKEDADLCNGTLFCNLATQKCQVNPKTVISCPSVDDSACAKNTCIAATGLCAMLSAKNGTGCSDDDACTEGDVCLGGKCAGGTDICKCKTDVDCVAKDDGDLCNGSYFCNKPIGACQFNPSSVVQCQTVDDTACLKSVCQPKTGQCQKLPVELAKKQCEGVNCAWVLKKAGDPDLANVFCEEGNACTVGDECAQGVCVPGTYVCSCKSDAECQDEDDGNLCNGTPFCDKSTAPATCKNNPATVISCGSVDDSECLKYQCVAKTGKCQFTPVADFTPCNDGSNCTKNDGCVFGKCQPGTFLCECATSDDCAKKDDGNACNGTWYCDKSADLFLCKYNPASVVFCGKKDDQPCLKNTCDIKTGACGMTPPTKGTPCDDGDACTTATSCQGQDCAAATKVDCDDGNACTTDSCDQKIGCLHKAANCLDGNDCTADQCDPKTGQCAFPALADGKACNSDDDGCTVNDACSGGQCKVGAAVVCKIALDACQVAACESTGAKSFACVALTAKDGAACLGTAPCSLGFACQLGQCQASAQDKLFVKEFASFGDSLAWRTVQATSSGAVVGGRRLQGAEDQPTGTSLVVAELAVDASPVWQVETASVGAFDDLVGVAAVQRLATGETAVVATRRFSSSGDLDLWVAKLAAGGKSFIADKQVVLAGTDAVFGAAYNAQVGWWAAGQQGSGSLARAWLVRLSESGTVLASWKSTAAAPDHLRAAIVLPDGGALAVGDREEGSVVRALLVRVDGQGGLVWQKTLGDTAPQALVALANSSVGYFAAGSRTSGGIELPLLVQLDAGGNVLGKYIGTSAAEVRSLAVLTGGRAVLAGSVGTGNGKQAWLQGFAAGLEPIWSSAHLASVPAAWQATTIGSDGGLWSVGSRAGPIRALAGRADPWGHLSCLTAGDCAALKAEACDDGQGCTYDLCEPGTGCVHAPSSAPCSDGNACTVDDLCQAGACLPGAVTTCDDGNVCTTDACDGKLGCGHGYATGGCSDGDACTTSDACATGSCQGVAVSCDDGSVCTKDSCDSKKGCVAVLDPKACDDGLVCTDDSCDLKKGCAHANNTVTCDAGDPCTEGDLCAGGACVGGSVATLFANSDLANSAGLKRIVAVAAAGDGGFQVAGDSSAAPTGFGVVGRVAAGGGSATLAKPAVGTAENHFLAVAAVKDGFVHAGSAAAMGAGGLDGWLHGTDATGQPLWSYAYGGAKEEVLRGIAPSGDGVLAVGSTTTIGAGGVDGWIVRVNGGGVLVKAAAVGGTGDDVFNAVTEVAGGGFLAAGSSTSAGGGGKDGWLVRLDSAGGVLWQHTYGMAGDQVFLRVIQLDDGDFMASGTTLTTGWLARVNGLGQARWYGGTELAGEIKGMATAPGGFMVASGGKLQRRDNTGTVLWTEDFASSCSALYDVVVLGDQSVVGGGQHMATSACLVHTDAWGHPSCATAGKCADKTAAQCDDANPCTGPGCDPATGCKPVNVAVPCQSGAACSTGDTCLAGACVAGPQRLWDVAHGTTHHDYYFGATQSRLGGILVPGGRNLVGVTDTALTVTRIGVSGAVIWQKVLGTTSGKNAAYYDATELTDGRLACSGATPSAAALRVFDPQGNSLFANAGGTGLYLSIIALPNDNLAVAGNDSAEGLIATYTDQAKLMWSIKPPGVVSCKDLVVGANDSLEVWCVGNNSAAKPNDVVRVVASSAGKLISSDHFATPSPIYRLAHGVDSDGDTYVAASVYPVTLGGGQKARIYLFKFGANGAVLWQRQVGAGASGYRMAIDIAMTAAGPVLVGQAGLGSNGATDGWLAGLDTSGNLVWQREIGGVGTDFFYGGEVIDNNLVLVGGTDSKGAGGYDEWLVRTDAWGQGPCSVSGPCVKLDAAACLDDQSCTADTCSPIDGCTHTASTCDDGNPCTTDACDAKSGCQWTPLADGTAACASGAKCAMGYCP